MTQSKLSTVITFGIATLLIAGCSDNKSTTGVSLSKEATACYSEYVDLHDDIRKAFDDQAATGTASKAEFGKKHYEALGGEAGRALPEECADLLKFSMNCYDRYVDTYPDLIEAWQASGQPKSVWGKTHYENHGKLAGRDFPGGGGCSYEYVPPPCRGDIYGSSDEWFWNNHDDGSGTYPPGSFDASLWLSSRSGADLSSAIITVNGVSFKFLYNYDNVPLYSTEGDSIWGFQESPVGNFLSCKTYRIEISHPSVGRCTLKRRLALDSGSCSS